MTFRPIPTIGAILRRLATVPASCLLLLVAAGAPAQEPAPRHWDQPAAEALLAYIDGVGSHGLDAADYQPALLRAALQSGEPVAIEKQATLSFTLVAADLARGHIKPGNRGRTYIVSDTLDPQRVALMIDEAIAKRDVAGVLERLAPANPQYRSLRLALAKLPPERAAERERIKLNLERWRWLPHDLGTRYVIVNIPEYRLRLVENGRLLSAHRVIVGKTSTPTPRFQARIKGVIINPSWHVPQSIVAESVGSLVRNRPQVARSRGYTWNWNGGKLNVTQMPGPENALGQMKLDMPNPLSIFVHDTPSKDLFERDVRAFSHGCIRTQDPFALGEHLLAGSEWTRTRIDAAAATRKTVEIPLEQPLPIYVVYLTAIAQADGSIREFDDVYKLDGCLEKQLASAGTEPVFRAAPGFESECKAA